MRILTLDYSTTSCGWCLCDSKTSTFKYGSIKPKGNLEERVTYIANFLSTFTNVDKVVVEEVSSMINAKTLRALLRGLGYALGKIITSYDNATYVTPSHWRKVAWGFTPRKTVEAKALAITSLKERGITCSNDDEAEAIGIMIYFLTEYHPGLSPLLENKGEL